MKEYNLTRIGQGLLVLPYWLGSESESHWVGMKSVEDGRNVYSLNGGDKWFYCSDTDRPEVKACEAWQVNQEALKKFNDQDLAHHMFKFAESVYCASENWSDGKLPSDEKENTINGMVEDVNGMIAILFAMTR